MGARLPTFKEICPNGAGGDSAPALGCESTHSWMPYDGQHGKNSWVYVGCGGHGGIVCKDHVKHHGNPGWGSGDVYGDKVDCMHTVTNRADPVHCHDWTCAEWCKYFDEADEAQGTYLAAGCADDGVDACSCDEPKIKADSTEDICPPDFPYKIAPGFDNSKYGLCYNTISSANGGSGPCAGVGSWCANAGEWPTVKSLWGDACGSLCLTPPGDLPKWPLVSAPGQGYACLTSTGAFSRTARDCVIQAFAYPKLCNDYADGQCYCKLADVEQVCGAIDDCAGVFCPDWEKGTTHECAVRSAAEMAKTTPNKPGNMKMKPRSSGL